MNKEDLGKYFIKDNQLYVAISYSDKPTMELKNILTGQRRSVVINSPYSTEFSKLFSIKPEEYGGYNLDNAKEVENITTNLEELEFMRKEGVSYGDLDQKSR